jgi:protoheme IX farnesyltransferase
VFANKNHRKGEEIIHWSPKAILTKKQLMSLSKKEQNYTMPNKNGSFMELTQNLKKPTLATWIQLTKPGIIMGNLLTAFGGFMLVPKQVNWLVSLLMMLLGLGLVIGSACVFNNMIDKDLDQSMTRTQSRGIPSGKISLEGAAVFGMILGCFGLGVLYFTTNTLTTVLALCGWILYVGVYSLMKYLTSFATWMGSLAGAIPPVVGYCAASNHFDLIALILFVIVACWQMPHFLAISIYRGEDYDKGNIPVLPRITNVAVTKCHMALYLLGFIFSSWMLYVAAHLNLLFILVMGVVGLLWLQVAVCGFFTNADKKWAKKMFFYSLIAITAFSLILPLSHLSYGLS